MSRKTISVSEAVYDHLDALKRDDESWSEFGERAANALNPTTAQALNATSTVSQPRTSTR